TASKLMWVKNNEPQVFSKMSKVLLPKDYIRFMLTGVFASEVSDASGTQLLDIANRRWSDDIINALGFKPDWLPDVFESTVISGHINAEAARLTGLIEGTPVAGGGGDQAAGGVGNGIVREGIVSSTIGSSGVVFAHLDNISIDKLGRVHTFCHAVPGKWHVMGVTQAAGISLKWFKDNFCTAEKEVANNLGVDVYDIMCREAAKSAPGSNGIVYLPYLMGERTPHLDPNAKGVFFGLSAIHNKSDMIRAVLEGVSYSLVDCIEIIRSMGVEISEVRASGGGGRSELWRQIQADMFNTNIITLSSSEGPCLGAAIIAGTGVGVYKDIYTACSQAQKVNTLQKPIKENADRYAAGYRLYKALYPALSHLYKAF
ncbi:MAG TPA: xylulokinase, partial [Clostridia bacterium]|nr:xylulokinase [Clostridia bacterium]